MIEKAQNWAGVMAQWLRGLALPGVLSPRSVPGFGGPVGSEQSVTPAPGAPAPKAPNLGSQLSLALNTVQEG